MTQVIDKEALKEALLKLAKEEPTFFKDLVRDAEKQTVNEKLKKIVEEDFEEYDEVFKALA